MKAEMSKHWKKRQDTTYIFLDPISPISNWPDETVINMSIAMTIQPRIRHRLFKSKVDVAQLQVALHWTNPIARQK